MILLPSYLVCYEYKDFLPIPQVISKREKKEVVIKKNKTLSSNASYIC